MSIYLWLARSTRDGWYGWFTAGIKFFPLGLFSMSNVMVYTNPVHSARLTDWRFAEFNQKSSILFVEIRQVFSLFFVPFYKSNVHLTTKLHLIQSQDGKYYIKGQEDLYQLNQVVKFFWPGGSTIVWLWQLLNALLCIVGAILLAPITWLEQGHSNRINGTKRVL